MHNKYYLAFIDKESERLHLISLFHGELVNRIFKENDRIIHQSPFYSLASL